jgi:hypothetical protein
MAIIVFSLTLGIRSFMTPVISVTALREISNIIEACETFANAGKTNAIMLLIEP